MKAFKYQCSDYYTQERLSLRYFCGVIKHVNKKDDEHESQKNSHSGLVKVYSLINNQATQSDTRLACILFHKIAEMYRDLKHQETLQ